jgi:hypothetical protein
MMPPDIQTSVEARRYYDALHAELIRTGKYHAFTLPWSTIGMVAVPVYLMFDHRHSRLRRALRIPFFLLVATHSIWVLLTNRARDAAMAYLTGLIPIFLLLWSATFLLYSDGQRDFKRLQYRNSVAFGRFHTDGKRTAKAADGYADGPVTRKDNGHANGDGKGSANAKSNGSAHGHADRPSNDTVRNVTSTTLTYDNPRRAETGPVYWQGYPTSSFLERLDWVVDLFTNFRGINWNFQIPDLPPRPSWVEADLAGKVSGTPEFYEHLTPTPDVLVSRTGVQAFTSSRKTVWYSAAKLFFGFVIILDILKLAVIHDRYFWGFVDPVPPAPAYLPSLIADSPFLLKWYRLLLGCGAIWAGISSIMVVGPLVYVGLLGPERVGIRGEPWANPPDAFGSLANVLDKGLAGYWAGFWHQIFRRTFEAPATKLMNALGIKPRSNAGLLVASACAFGVSALLHMSGSFTELGDTRPLSGPGLFFVLQPLGIFAQIFFVRALRASGLAKLVPRWLGRLGNFTWMMYFLYYTAPLLVEDFARGGVLLFEPLPFSPTRALGLAPAKEEAIVGRFPFLLDGVAFWHQGPTWWQSGLAL